MPHTARSQETDRWKGLIRSIPDFPSPGIIFRDITPLLRDAEALSGVVEALADGLRPGEIDAVVAVESRGFIFGAPLATRLDAGFVPIRKLGKLPFETLQQEYALEYGSGHLEIHRDAIRPGDRVLLVDDLLATGGTAAAAASMVELLGGVVVWIRFVIELPALAGRARLSTHHPVSALLTF